MLKFGRFSRQRSGAFTMKTVSLSPIFDYCKYVGQNIASYNFDSLRLWLESSTVGMEEEGCRSRLSLLSLRKYCVMEMWLTAARLKSL